MINLKFLLTEREHDFGKILEDPRVIKTNQDVPGEYLSVFDDSSDSNTSSRKDIMEANDNSINLNIIIGFHRRPAHLNSVVNSFLKNKKYLHNFRIIIVEIDTEPTLDYQDCCIKRLSGGDQIEYIFIPLDLIGTRDLYSRALAFNIGYYISKKTDYYLFHDCDILASEHFIDTLYDSYISKNITWLQAFCKKRLFMLNESTTKCIFARAQALKGNDQSAFDSTPFPPVGSRGDFATPGAAGGSTLVRRDIFESVGGFDSEIYYGYAPEDSLFLTKLCCLERKLDEIDTCHNASAEHYADDPPIELCHLYHENLVYQNYALHCSLKEVLFVFWKLPYEEKLKYIQEKRKMLKEYAKAF